MSDLVWIHYSRPRTAWYELDEQRRAGEHTRFVAVRGASRERGGAQLGTFSVRGQSDYSTVEVWTFPDADAAFDHWRRLVDAGYAEWFEAANSVGLRMAEEVAHG